MVAAGPPRLSKSRYLAGLQCERQLWLGVHRAELATEPDEALRAIFEMGAEVGRAAHALFPGGVLVDEPYWRHEEAVARTRALLADESVPAIFEAAFEHAGVRVRVDALERLGGGRFGLREVKATASVKPEHHPDVAVQRFVLQGCGLQVPSAELVHIDTGFVRGDGPIDWSRFFRRVDLTAEAEALRPEVAARVAAMHGVLGRPQAPAVEPSRHCWQPHACPFWEHCTAGRSAEWILSLRRASDERRARQREALRSGRTWVSPDLGPALGALRPPLWHLDFETIAPAMPVYAGTRPFETIPLQWSLHRVGADGSLEHREFLAEGGKDPRRAVAERLLDTLRSDAAPIAVWSSYEDRQLAGLADALPDLAIALADVRGRLVDLHPIVRRHVYHPGFAGSFSLKVVAPALAPGFGYDDLDGIADGTAAATALLRLAAGDVPDAEAARLRAALLAYCERDTLALVEVVRALRDLARG